MKVCYCLYCWWHCIHSKICPLNLKTNFRDDERWRLSMYEFCTLFTFPQYVKIQFLFKHPSWSSWLLVSGCASLFCWRKLIHFTITFSFSLPYFTSPLWMKWRYFFFYPASFSFVVFFSLPFSNSYSICHVTFLFLSVLPFSKFLLPSLLSCLFWHIISHQFLEKHSVLLFHHS